jgi:carboxypeptidase D
VIAQSQGSKSDYVVSSYDARRTEQHGSPRMFPPGHKVVEAYLGGWDLKYDTGTLDVSVKDQVLKAIHATAATAGSQRYQECTDPPYNALSGQDGKGVVDDIVAVLEHASAPRLLFFNGMDDLIWYVAYHVDSLVLFLARFAYSSLSPFNRVDSTF